MKTCEVRFDSQQNTTTTPSRPVFPVDIIVVQWQKIVEHVTI